MSTRDALWAIILGYELHRVSSDKPTARGDWIVWWLSVNIHELNDSMKQHARKILSNPQTTVPNDDGLRVRTSEFIIDSLFALDIGIEHLPKHCTKISKHWVDMVKTKSLLSNGNKLHC
jgi:hypothetical protein